VAIVSIARQDRLHVADAERMGEECAHFVA
jgi:hypothetical protein